MSILGLFARYPEPGRTKTRLAAAIGDQAAAELYDDFVHDLTERLQHAADQLWIAVTPDSPECRVWYATLPIAHESPGCRMLVQPEGDLGHRIHWFFEQAEQSSDGPAVLIGTDNPDLPLQRVEQAFQVLAAQESDIVIVPATDGGYVLIGLNGPADGLFDHVRWSSPFTLLDTLAAAATAKRTVHVLPLWYDIDTLEDLGTFAALQSHQGQTEAAECRRTAVRLPQIVSDTEEG